MPARVIQGIDELKALTGQEVAVSEWYTVSQDLIDRFAGVTGDHQWIHTDTERAKTESPYRSTIAHGFLTLSLVSRASSESIQLAGAFNRRINYGLNRVRFPAPVLSGSRVRYRFGLMSVNDIEGGWELIWDITGETETAEKPALIAQSVSRVYR